jgi:hypothetical protein
MYGRCGSIYVWSGVRSVLVAMRTSHNNARGQCRDIHYNIKLVKRLPTTVDRVKVVKTDRERTLYSILLYKLYILGKIT